MKSTFWGTLVVFVLIVFGLALLSLPSENTLIEMYFDNKKLKRAEELLSKRYARDPKDLATATKLADTLMALNEIQRAKNVAQEVLLRYPDSVAWKRRLAFTLLAENDPFAASEILSPGERTKDFGVLLAEKYHSMAQDTLAEEALFFAYKDSLNKAEPWVMLASWRADRKDVEGEKEALEQALQYVSSDITLVVRYFYNRAQAGDLQSTLWAADILKKNGPLDRPHLETLYSLFLAHHKNEAAREILEQLIERADATVADTLAFVSFLYLQKDFTRAKYFLEKLSYQGKTFSSEVQNAIDSQTLAVQNALLFEAAHNGDEQTVLEALCEMRSHNNLSSESLRNMIYVCIQLSEFFKSAPTKKRLESTPAFLQNKDVNWHEHADFWLTQAKELLAKNSTMLPLSEIANARLVADLAERSADWQAMLVAWNRIAIANEHDPQAWLGIARASQQLKDYDSSLQSLHKAETLAGDDVATRLVLVLQFQALTAALPSTFPQRMETQRYADAMARKHLVMSWNDDVALNSFFRALASNDLREAEKLVEILGTRGLVTAHEYLGLAEASLSLELGRIQKEGRANTVPSGPERERIARYALRALNSDAPEVLSRVLYVFTAIEDKKQVLDLLQRLEKSFLLETAEGLRQRADAYGFLGDRARQLALIEKRARLTGKLADWNIAIDNHYWAKKFDDAMHLLEIAEKAHPGASELLARRILILVDMEKYRQALKAFQNAQRQDPAVSEKLHAESLAALAVAYDKTHLTYRARHFFKRSLEKDPANQRASFGMASLARREGKNAEAVRYLQAYSARNPTNLWAQLELAHLRPHLGKQQYNQVLVQTKPDAQGKVAPDSRAVRALALWRAGRLQEALSVYTSIMQEDRKNPNIMCDYAQLLMETHRYEDAKKILARTIQLFPDHIWAYRLEATILIREKDYARAEAYLRQALGRAPLNSEVLRDLAFVQQTQRKPWAAQKHWLGAGKR